MAVMDPVPDTQASAGQISADGRFRWDGQQWVPLGPGEREATPWTRPMQLASAAVLALSAISGVILTLAFVNHDSVMRSIQAQGAQLPTNTNVDTVINLSIGITWAVVIAIGLIELFAALGSFLGWRWIFWGVLVIFALDGLGALLNVSSLANPSRATMPFGALTWSEIVSLAGLAMFIWMLVAVIKYGPWAMKRPGT
jgi:hypothetical protein